jgi:hypothetical protein
MRVWRTAQPIAGHCLNCGVTGIVWLILLTLVAHEARLPIGDTVIKG